MGMTPEREKEIRETLRGNTTSDYADAHALLQELDELRGKLRWIPVGERLPEPGVRVLTWREGQNALNGEYLDGSWLTYGDWSRVRMFLQPTHWMAMPALPGPGESDPLTEVPEKPYIKPAMGFGASGLPEGFNDPAVKHSHDEPTFYANCPACVAGHAGVFVGEKGTDRKCEARFDGGRTYDCEVFPSMFKDPHCQVCGQHHEAPACTASQ